MSEPISIHRAKWDTIWIVVTPQELNWWTSAGHWSWIAWVCDKARRDRIWFPPTSNRKEESSRNQDDSSSTENAASESTNNCICKMSQRSQLVYQVISYIPIPCLINLKFTRTACYDPPLCFQIKHHDALLSSYALCWTPIYILCQDWETYWVCDYMMWWLLDIKYNIIMWLTRYDLFASNLGIDVNLYQFDHHWIVIVPCHFSLYWTSPV